MRKKKKPAAKGAPAPWGKRALRKAAAWLSDLWAEEPPRAARPGRLPAGRAPAGPPPRLPAHAAAPSAAGPRQAGACGRASRPARRHAVARAFWGAFCCTLVAVGAFFAMARVDIATRHVGFADGQTVYVRVLRPLVQQHPDVCKFADVWYNRLVEIVCPQALGD